MTPSEVLEYFATERQYAAGRASFKQEEFYGSAHACVSALIDTALAPSPAEPVAEVDYKAAWESLDARLNNEFRSKEFGGYVGSAFVRDQMDLAFREVSESAVAVPAAAPAEERDAHVDIVSALNAGRATCTKAFQNLYEVLERNRRLNPQEPAPKPE